MISATLALLFASAQQPATIGDFTVAFQPGASVQLTSGDVRLILRPVGVATTVESSRSQLTAHSELAGSKITRRFTRSEMGNGVRVEVTVQTEPGQAVGDLIDSYEPGTGAVRLWPSEPVQSEAEWTLPGTVYRVGGRRVGLFPDLKLLERNRGLTAVLKGFGYGYTASPSTSTGEIGAAGRRPAPTTLTYAYTIALEPAGRTDWPHRELWTEHGDDRFLTPWPQSQSHSTTATYIARLEMAANMRLEPVPGFERGRTRWWTKTRSDGRIVGGVAYQPVIHLTSEANTVLSTYGLDVWGAILKQNGWRTRAAQSIRLVLESTVGQSEYDVENDRWGGSSTALDRAVTGYWLVRYSDHAQLDDELSAAVVKRLGELAESLDQSSGPAGQTFLIALSKSEKAPLELRQRATARASDTMDVVEGVSAWRLMDWTEKRMPLEPTEEIVNDILLRQSLWDVPSRPGIAGFGAISEGIGQLDATTSEYALALMRAGELHQRPDWFRRGVIALRGALGGFHDFTDPMRRYRYMDNVPLNQASLSFGHNAKDMFDPVGGFEAGEGKLLGIMGEAMLRYGSAYEFASGEVVGVDAVYKMADGTYASLLEGNRIPNETRSPYWTEVTRAGRQLLKIGANLPRLTDVQIDPEATGPTLLGLTGATFNAADAEAARASFVVGDQRLPARISDRGFSAAVTAAALDRNPVTFEVSQSNGQSLTLLRDVFWNPMLDPLALAPRGWLRRHGLADGGLTSLRDPNGSWMSTADDGSGHRRPELTGLIDSPAFTAGDYEIQMLVRGREGAEIALILVETGETIFTYTATTGEPEELAWDVRAFAGQRLYIQLRDPSATGWIESSAFRISTAPVLPPGDSARR